MKKLLLITSIAIVLLSTSKAKAQTVCAGGKSVTLTAEKICYLRGFKNNAINIALDGHANICYNSTADLIISILSKFKPVKK